MTIGVYRRAEKPEQYCDVSEYHDLLFNDAVLLLEKSGATVVDDIEIPSFHRDWNAVKQGLEFKHCIENYLQSLPSHIPVHTLKELVEWDELHAEKALKYGQDHLEHCLSIENPLKQSDYSIKMTTNLYYSQEMGIDYALKQYGLDAILFPAYVGADISARAGYPHHCGSGWFSGKWQAFRNNVCWNGIQ